MRHPLPYAFARSQQLLLEEADDGRCTLWMSSHPSRSALSEVTRKYGVQAFEVLADGPLAQRISAAYAQGESSAAAVVSEVQSDADLSRMMQELPAVEDLLESAGEGGIRSCSSRSLAPAASACWRITSATG
jgi:general secretion pathway protein E